MSKFKVGDKVRCVKPTQAIGVHVGDVYTFKGISHKSQFGTHVNLEEVLSTPTTDTLELVQEDAILTPEEVFKHLRKGTKLQCSSKATDNWCDHSGTLNRIKVNELLDYKWRIKPEPEVIELNGKKYREIVE